MAIFTCYHTEAGSLRARHLALLVRENCERDAEVPLLYRPDPKPVLVVLYTIPLCKPRQGERTYRRSTSTFQAEGVAGAGDPFNFPSKDPAAGRLLLVVAVHVHWVLSEGVGALCQMLRWMWQLCLRRVRETTKTLLIFASAPVYPKWTPKPARVLMCSRSRSVSMHEQKTE